MLNTMNERHLYVVHAISGWRIERPSGGSVARAIASFEEVAAALADAGYEPARNVPPGLSGNIRFDKVER